MAIRLYNEVSVNAFFLATSGLLIQISLRSSTILYFSADRLNCAKFPSLECAHISLWLNPMGHSKFHNTSKHPPPATDSGRTARTPLYLPVQAVPFTPYPQQLQQLALNVHVKHSVLT